MKNNYVKIPPASAIMIFISLLLAAAALAQNTEVVTVKYEAGQNIRALADKYLGDPNLWTEILKMSDITSAELKPGVTLRIDAGPIIRADGVLENSMNTIQEATMAGARMFTPEIIGEAIEFRDIALEKRASGEWDECARLASSSIEKANVSIGICHDNQNIPAEAVVNYRKGQVQKRKEEDHIWSDAGNHEILLEGEKVRTMSQSLAGILFRDDSHLRLENNSHVVIQKMRSNLLDNSEEAKVSLVEGDVYALLGGSSSKKKFDLDVPGVDVNINSVQFWVGKDENTTRFANYDGELEITSAGGTVKLGKNQGSIISRNQRPTSAKALFVQPVMISPEDTLIVFDTNIEFFWEKVKDAASYWLEVAHDRDFTDVVVSRKRIRGDKIKEFLPDNQIYYWRISAMDEYGLPGPHERSRLLIVLKDDQAPYLVVYKPLENQVFRDSVITIGGVTENNISLMLNDKPLDIKRDGTFNLDYHLQPGMNSLQFKAVDLAGNTSEVTRAVRYLDSKSASRKSEFKSSDAIMRGDHLLVPVEGVTFRGKTEPGRLISVNSRSNDTAAKTYADDNGDYLVNLRIQDPRENFELDEFLLDGNVVKDSFKVEMYGDRPGIIFDKLVPRVVSNPEIEISGAINNGKSLTINGDEVEIGGGKFRHCLKLAEGVNNLIFSCTDELGNVTRMEKQVLLDFNPPDLIDYRFSPVRTAGGEAVSLILRAKDSSTLKRLVPFTASIGDFKYSGHLVYNKSLGRYEAQVFVPAEYGGRLSLDSVELEDFYGNSKEYKL
ncbi:MAG: FecR domain-containing protein [FCB group bacterium]|nr:FecR domain-containing protein [FCB group bacterium]